MGREASPDGQRCDSLTSSIPRRLRNSLRSAQTGQSLLITQPPKAAVRMSGDGEVSGLISTSVPRLTVFFIGPR